MPSIGDVYNPLIAAAEKGDRAEGDALLRKTGEAIFAANPGKCPSVEDGMEAAKRNLDYYCQYFDSEVASKVKAFYGLGAGFRAITGVKLPII